MSLFRKELTDLLRPLLQPPGMTQKLVDALDDFLDRAGVPRDGAALAAGGAAGAGAGAGVGAAPAAHFRKELTDLCRPQLKPPGFTQALVDTLDELLDRAGVPRDGVAAASSPSAPAGPAPASPTPAAPVPAAPTGKLDGAMLRKLLGLLPDAPFDAAARKALFARLSNRQAAPLTEADFAAAAASLGVSPNMIKAVRKVEAPRGSFDDEGRPTILYERHVFSRNSGRRFDASHPILSSRTQGGYGRFSIQYDKFADACALDPEAAFKACSWGAFQVLGENAVALGYASAYDMVQRLLVSEAAHLDSFVRFVRTNKLVDKLRACRAGDPASCVPFVKAYNGKDFAKNNYHVNLANAAR
jgi:hypothetical protein